MRQSVRLLYLLALGLALLVIWQVLRPPRSEAVPQPNTAAVQPAGTAQVFTPLIIKGCPSQAPTCAATATAGPSPTATIRPTATTGPSPTEPASTPGLATLPVGVLGYSDAGTHQVLRTSGDRVYIFAPEIYKSYIRAMRATNIGTPAGFVEADQAHRPATASAVWSVDTAIDANDVVHVLYILESGPVIYQTFDTTTDQWGPTTTLTNSAWPNRNNGLRQGSAGIALVVDADGVAHAVYGKTQSGRRHVYYNNNQGGTWTHETLVDDQPNSDNSHATLAFGPDDTLYVAWLSDNTTTGSIRVRAQRNAAWATASQVDGNVFHDTTYSIDQGPSMLVTADGKVHIAYIGIWETVAGAPQNSAYGRLHHKYSDDGGGTWTADDPPLRYTHDPTLATDPQGNLYVFGHRESWKAATCADMLVSAQPSGEAWSRWKVLVSGCYDSSVSVKWSQHFWHRPSTLDLLYWTEHGPSIGDDINQLYYAEIQSGLDAINGLPNADGS